MNARREECRAKQYLHPGQQFEDFDTPAQVDVRTLTANGGLM